METWRRRESGSLISGLLCLLIVEGHDPREWNRSFNNVAKCTRERKCETEYRDKGYGHVITRTSICEIDSMIIESLHLQIRRLIVSSSFVYIFGFFFVQTKFNARRVVLVVTISFKIYRS